jgi:molybdopterin converting factor small subunit
VARLRLFGRLADLAGTSFVEVDEKTAEGVRESVCERFGAEFSELARRSRIWVNGGDPPPGLLVTDSDEVALLPPVSGG